MQHVVSMHHASSRAHQCPSSPAPHPHANCMLAVLASQKDAPVERCCRFMGTLARVLPAGDEPCAALLEALCAQLGLRLSAIDKVVRFRSCQLLANILQQLPPSASLSEGLLELLAEGLTGRLQDKVAAVRSQAARALGRLCTPDEVRRCCGGKGKGALACVRTAWRERAAQLDGPALRPMRAGAPMGVGAQQHCPALCQHLMGPYPCFCLGHLQEGNYADDPVACALLCLLEDEGVKVG